MGMKDHLFLQPNPLSTLRWRQYSLLSSWYPATNQKSTIWTVTTTKTSKFILRKFEFREKCFSHRISLNCKKHIHIWCLRSQYLGDVGGTDIDITGCFPGTCGNRLTKWFPIEFNLFCSWKPCLAIQPPDTEKFHDLCYKCLQLWMIAVGYVSQ
jgi:hypothetical protein